MIFNQLEFLFLFLPITLLAFYIPFLRQFRIVVLTVSSIIFYSFSGKIHALLLCVDVIWVWVLATPGDKKRLFAAISGPLLGLIYFKYSGFLFETVGLGDSYRSSGFARLLDENLLPAGISFFTFQIIGYAIDRYRGEDSSSFGVFAFFVSFFPQLVAGPIVRFSEIRDQIAEIGSFLPTNERVLRFTTFVSVGLFLKVGLADTLAVSIARLGADPNSIPVVDAWYSVFAYSFQIYLDFFGYSLMAVGLGHLFGIKLPENFRVPYLARDPRDFWRRWHITLSYWIRDYLYLPLGGNRRYYVNIFFVFAICGLWHGAAWTYVVWGVFHAALVCGFGASECFWRRIPRYIQIALTFFLVSLGWTFFRYDFSNSTVFLFQLFNFETFGSELNSVDVAVFTIAAILAMTVSHALLEKSLTFCGVKAFSVQVMIATLFVLSLFLIDTSQSFIYFRF